MWDDDSYRDTHLYGNPAINTDVDLMMLNEPGSGQCLIQVINISPVISDDAACYVVLNDIG